MNLRVFGPPGAGKTYTLTRIVYHMIGEEDNTQMFDGYGVELPHGKYTIRDVAYISFTNSAVDELLSRLGIKRNYKRGKWGTLHGLLLHMLIDTGVMPKELVNKTFGYPSGVTGWKKKFAAEVGIPYDPDEEIQVLPGNQFFGAYAKAVNIYYPKYGDLQRVLDKVEDMNEWGWLGDVWIKFKEREGIIDFEDILIEGYHHIANIPTDVLVADEFQDFSPLQWEIFKNWMDGKDYVIVAGDDDQAIYEFQGSSPEFILYEFPADETIVLKQSFRVPRILHKASRLLVEKFLKHRYPKKFNPREAMGKFAVARLNPRQIVALAEKIAERGETVLVLARTNAQVSDLEEAFLTSKIPYYRFKTKKTMLWRDFLDRIINFVEALKKGEEVDTADARFFLRFTKLRSDKVSEVAKQLADPKQRPLDVYKIVKAPHKLIQYNKVVEFFDSQVKARLAMEALENYAMGKISKVPGKIYVDTIHAAKGREGDYVILLDSITDRIFQEIYGDLKTYESEIRVWYVGLTRARKGVVLVKGDMEFVRPHLTRAGWRWN